MDLQTYLTAQWPLLVFIGLIACFTIQAFYHLFFFARLAFFKSRDRFQSQTHPVSVVICARDEAHNLEQNITAIMDQDYRTTHEVIIVNDNSFDDTKFFLEELEKVYRRLRPISLTQEAKHIPGKKYPLSVGIKSSKYEILLLTDADCKPASEYWVQKMQDGYHAGIDIVLGYAPHNKTGGFFNKLVRFETFHTALQYLSYALAGKPYMGVGRNLSYKRGIYYENKGFSSLNHLLGGDDDLFINKVATPKNTNVVVDPDTFMYSDGAKHMSDWWKQKSRHYSTSKYYKPSHKFWLGLYATTQVLFWPLLAAAAFNNWMYALPFLAARWLIMGMVFGKAMHRLRENDLIPIFWILDIWQFFYHLIFSVTLWIKPQIKWK